MFAGYVLSSLGCSPDPVAGAYLEFQVNSRRMFALCENHEFVKTLLMKVARPSCDVAGRDPLLDQKRLMIERVQSSEFNRQCHGKSIGCNGLVLNRIVSDRLIWDVWQLYQGRWETLVRGAKMSTVTPIFFFLISKRKVSGRFWRFLKKF